MTSPRSATTSARPGMPSWRTFAGSSPRWKAGRGRRDGGETYAGSHGEATRASRARHQRARGTRDARAVRVADRSGRADAAGEYARRALRFRAGEPRGLEDGGWPVGHRTDGRRPEWRTGARPAVGRPRVPP